MRVFREHARARTSPRHHIIAPGVLLLAAVVVAPGSSPRTHTSAGITSPGSARSAVAVKAVAPTVSAVAIPAVTPGKRAALSAGLPRANQGRLIAHLKRPALPLFSMVAVSWDQQRRPEDLAVEVRTRYGGSWTRWTELGTDTDGPSAAQDTSVRAGTTPLWVDRATGVEVAVYASGPRVPSRVKVDTIDPGRSTADSTIFGRARADAAKSRGGHQAGTFPRIPTIVTRAEWGADESLGDACWNPRYGTRFDAAIVHHTAGSNDYTKAESAAVVRGILAYHTVVRGWCDIGYNFLIDRYGTIYEGRGGGIRRPVRGAHSGDYNVDTTGISLMGNFDIAGPTRVMKHSLVQLIAWRLGTAYHGAYGKVFLYDGRFNRISGHRDVMQTACPGRYVYSWLPTLRERVRNRLGDFESRIEAAWRTAGAKSSVLGSVRVGERGENGGHHTTFANGRMYVSKDGLYTLYPGPVLARYVMSGETEGELGYPASGVRTAATGGLAAEFSGGRIYWSAATDAHILRRGAVLQRYLRERGATGRLGFPLTPVHGINGGTRADFEAGYITYDVSTHKTTVTIR